MYYNSKGCTFEEVEGVRLNQCVNRFESNKTNMWKIC